MTGVEDGDGDGFINLPFNYWFPVFKGLNYITMREMKIAGNKDKENRRSIMKKGDLKEY